MPSFSGLVWGKAYYTYTYYTYYTLITLYIVFDEYKLQFHKKCEVRNIRIAFWNIYL
jgi:hypothetical protein